MSEASLRRWKEHGVKDVTFLHTRDRKTADSEDFIKPLQRATAVWIGGGSQSNLADAYANTAVEREIKAVIERGGVVGGTSAGAAIQSHVMIASGKSVPKMREGFDLLPHAIIDQHFLKRNRMNRLLSAVQKHPECIGVGIDEATAIEVHGQECKVLGSSYVTVVFRLKESGPLDVQTFEAGETFSLEKKFE